MKKLMLGAFVILFTMSISAQQLNINRENLGSGSPELRGVENAVKWDDNIYHAPQYLPGFPTAATLWPRVVDVNCDKFDNMLKCDGYHWTPDMGRGEYLMIHPVLRKESPPEILIKEIPIIILKEVPIKTKKE